MKEIDRALKRCEWNSLTRTNAQLREIQSDSALKSWNSKRVIIWTRCLAPLKANCQTVYKECTRIGASGPPELVNSRSTHLQWARKWSSSTNFKNFKHQCSSTKTVISSTKKWRKNYVLSSENLYPRNLFVISLRSHPFLPFSQPIFNPSCVFVGGTRVYLNARFSPSNPTADCYRC